MGVGNLVRPFTYYIECCYGCNVGFSPFERNSMKNTKMIYAHTGYNDKESIGYDDLVASLSAQKKIEQDHDYPEIGGKVTSYSTQYKFREDVLLDELRSYIDKTYSQHYAGGKIQATEDIIDDGHGTGFCIGNAKKYLKRYGKKGETPEEWRKDIIKVLHYALIQLYIHDLEHNQ